MSKTRKLNLLFALVQIFYWTAECSICGLPVVFFGRLGFSDSQIGIICAMESLCIVLSQSAYPGILARFKKLSILSLLSILYALSIVISGVAFFLKPVFGLFLIVFGLLAILQEGTSTLLNSVAMDYLNQGYRLNFGLTRGLGSVAWAIAGIAFGKMLDHIAPLYLMIVNIIGLILTQIFLSLMASLYPLSQPKTEPNRKEKHGISIVELMRSNPTLLLISFGSMIMYLGLPSFSAQRLPNFMERFRGTASDAGLAVFFAAGSEFPMMILADFLQHKIEVRKIMRFSVLMYMIKPFTIFFAPNKTLLMLTQLLNGPSFGMYMISSVSYVNEIADDETRVASQSYFAAFENCGNTVGNLLSGLLMDAAGITGMALYGGITILLGGTLLQLGLNRKSQESRVRSEE